MEVCSENGVKCDVIEISDRSDDNDDVASKPKQRLVMTSTSYQVDLAFR